MGGGEKKKPGVFKLSNLGGRKRLLGFFFFFFFFWFCFGSPVSDKQKKKGHLSFFPKKVTGGIKVKGGGPSHPPGFLLFGCRGEKTWKRAGGC